MAILVRNNLNVKIIDVNNLTLTGIEVICICVQVAHYKSFAVSCVYRPEHNSSDFAGMEYLFNFLNVFNKSVYILGDFNVNLLDNNPESKKLNTLLQRFSFTQILSSPTRIDSLLDLIIVKESQRDRVISSYVYNEAISDHRFCVCNIRVKNITSQNVIKLGRNWKNINFESLIHDFDRDDYFVNLNNDVNELMQELTNRVLSVFNREAPIVQNIVKSGGKIVIISSRTCSLIRERDNCYWIWRRTNSVYDRCEYNNLCKIVKNSIVKDVKRSTNESIKKIGVWATLKKFGLKFGKIEGEIGSGIDLNEINDYYCTMGFHNNAFPYDTLSVNNSVADLPGMFSVKSVSANELFVAWKGLKQKSSASPDVMGMSKRMLKMCLPIPSFRDALLLLFNRSFETGIIPSQLKLSKVILRPKINNAVQPVDFRPISLTPNLLLLMEKIYYNRLDKYITSNKMLSPAQFGFRKGHNTEHLILALNDLIKIKLNQGYVCALVSIDQAKAFDSVSRELLLQKLRSNFNISDHWLRDYLRNRMQFVSTNYMQSNVRKTLVGVPAGSILGPRLFSLHIDDLPQVLIFGTMLLFADDSNIFFFGLISDLETLQNNVNTDLLNVVNYCKENSLALHPDKTKILLISARSSLKYLGDFKINVSDIDVTPCDKLKCVGFIFDSKLSYNLHINNMARIAYFRVRSMYTIKSYFSKESLERIGVAMVLSVIMYMASVWGSAKCNQLIIVEKVLRSLARLVLGKRKYDPVAEDIRNDLKWLFPKEMSDYRLLCIMFKLLKSNNVPFFTDYFVKVQDLHHHNTRTAVVGLTSSVNPRTNYGLTTFNFRGVKLWNNLRNDIKNEECYVTFKAKLKRIMLE